MALKKGILSGMLVLTVFACGNRQTLRQRISGQWKLAWVYGYALTEADSAIRIEFRENGEYALTGAPVPESGTWKAEQETQEGQAEKDFLIIQRKGREYEDVMEIRKLTEDSLVVVEKTRKNMVQGLARVRP